MIMGEKWIEICLIEDIQELLKKNSDVRCNAKLRKIILEHKVGTLVEVTREIDNGIIITKIVKITQGYCRRIL